LLRLAQGDVASAMDSIRDAVDNPSVLPSWEVPPNTELRRAPRLAAQVEIAVAGADLETARSAANELEDIAGKFGSKALRASAAIARGTVQLAEGEAFAARRSFEEGMRLWHDLKAPYEAARARIGVAEAYRIVGNEERAAFELQSARSTFERLGAKADARRAAALLSAAKHGHFTALERDDKVFMFTDIVKSTNLVELIGDEAWGHLVRWHNETIASLVAGQGGEVVRTTGDGFFVTFDTTREALECAIAIQRTLAQHRREHGFAPWVRIGLHRGEATRDKLDWSGVWVHVAARIGALADAEEILVSSDTLRGEDFAFTTSPPRSVSLKGIPEPVDVVSVVWR
jgi:class 3 adenylate cyclase